MLDGDSRDIELMMKSTFNYKALNFLLHFCKGRSPAGKQYNNKQLLVSPVLSYK